MSKACVFTKSVIQYETLPLMHSKIINFTFQENLVPFQTRKWIADSNIRLERDCLLQCFKSTMTLIKGALVFQKFIDKMSKLNKNKTAANTEEVLQKHSTHSARLLEGNKTTT